MHTYIHTGQTVVTHAWCGLVKLAMSKPDWCLYTPGVMWAPQWHVCPVRRASPCCASAIIGMWQIESAWALLSQVWLLLELWTKACVKFLAGRLGLA